MSFPYLSFDWIAQFSIRIDEFVYFSPDFSEIPCLFFYFSRKDLEFRCDFLPKYPFRNISIYSRNKGQSCDDASLFWFARSKCVRWNDEWWNVQLKNYGVINNHFILFNHLWIFIYSLFAAGNMNAQPLFLHYITVDFYIFFLVFRSHIINAYAINVKPRTLSIKTHNEATENAFWYSFRLFRCLSNWAILHQQTKLLKHFYFLFFILGII